MSTPEPDQKNPEVTNASRKPEISIMKRSHNPKSNVIHDGDYKIGDYCYFDTNPNDPYQIRKIEEIIRSDSQVHVKVQNFCRRRDIPPTCQQLADKHVRELEEDLYENQWTELEDLDKHQLQHREVYMSRSSGTDTLPVSQIRGKCDVTLLSSTDKFSEDYLKMEKTHFYTLVYDQNQRTVVTDRGDIRVGPTYQAEIPETMTELQRQNKLDNRKPELLETLVFDGAELLTPGLDSGLDEGGEKEDTSCSGSQEKIENGDAAVAAAESSPKNINDEDSDRKESNEDTEAIDAHPGHKFKNEQKLNPIEEDLERLILVAKSVGLFSRAIDATAATVQATLQVAACMASRDSTIQWAMDCMHNAGYDLGEAIRRVVTSEGPVLVRDQLESWSPSEAQLFEDGVDRYGKEFNLIRQECLPWKTYASIIEFYYMWKASDRYLSYKKTKAMEQEKKLLSFTLPDGHTEIRNGAAIQSESATAASARPCEGCCTLTSDIWYNWGPKDIHNLRLCSDCWPYWKKYGGLKIPQNQRVELMQQQQRKVPGTNDEKKSALRVSTQMNTVELQRKQKELKTEKELKKKMKEESANDTEDGRKSSADKELDPKDGIPMKKIKLDGQEEEEDSTVSEVVTAETSQQV